MTRTADNPMPPDHPRRQALALALFAPALALSACARTPSGYLPSDTVAPLRGLERGLPPMPLLVRLPAFPDPDAAPAGSLARALARTLPQSPIIRQALFAVASASSEARAADARMGPDLGLEGRFGATDSAGREPMRRDVLGGAQGSFMVFDNGAGSLRRDRSRWLVAAAVASLHERVEAVAFNLVEASASRERNAAVLALGDRQVDTFQRLLSTVRVQADVGIASRADVEEATTRLERVRASRVALRVALEDAETRWRRITGEGEVPAFDERLLPQDGAGSPEEMAETHPSVVALDAEVRAGIRNALSVDAERLGSVALQFGPSGFMQAFGGANVWALGSAFLRLSLPLIDSGERGARLRQAVAQLEVSLARRRDAALAVAAGIRQARTALSGAEETLEIARREEAAAGRLVATKTAEWRAGIADLRAVLDATQSRTDSASRAEAARWDARIARLRLAATAGRLAAALGVAQGEGVDMTSSEPYRLSTGLLSETPASRRHDELR